MPTTAGPNLTTVATRGDAFAGQVTAEIRRTLRQVAANLSPTVTLDDLSTIRDLWISKVNEVLLAHVRAGYDHGVDTVAGPVRESVHAHLGLTAAAPNPAKKPVPPSAGAAAGFAVPMVSEEIATAFMDNAANRLVNVANSVWEVARAQLADGLRAGEGISDLRDRLTASTDLAAPRAEVIARTEINSAVNAGAVAEMQAIAVPATKTWMATNDERTRPSHSDADGQEVDVNEPFLVDDEPLDQPGDPNGSPENVINCRCCCTFSIPEDSIGDLAPSVSEEDMTASAAVAEDSLVAAGNGADESAMIALVPSEADCQRLAVDGGEPPDVLHCTLSFLGAAADYDPQARAGLIAYLQSLCADLDGPITANVFGVNHWNPAGENPSWVYAVGDDPASPGVLNWVHDMVGMALSAAEVTDLVPVQHSPWCAHVCAAYTSDSSALATMVDRTGPVTFDRVRVAFAGVVTDIPLGPG